MAVEIKSFVGHSQLSEFHTALGQYINYREALVRNEPDRQLYLAVPVDAFRAFFAQEIVTAIIEKEGLKLLAFDPASEKVIEWNN